MGQLVARATLCTFTVVVIVLYSIALCGAHVRPLPEQQWIRGALLLLVLFQDPGLFLRFIAGGSSGKGATGYYHRRSEETRSHYAFRSHVNFAGAFAFIVHRYCRQYTRCHRGPKLAGQRRGRRLHSQLVYALLCCPWSLFVLVNDAPLCRASRAW